MTLLLNDTVEQLIVLILNFREILFDLTEFAFILVFKVLDRLFTLLLPSFDLLKVVLPTVEVLVESLILGLLLIATLTLNDLIHLLDGLLSRHPDLFLPSNRS
jgi:hypothetical protein